MKFVPISPNNSINYAKLYFPENVCVGCIKDTTNKLTVKQFGFSNAWFKNVSYPLCETCQELERKRREAYPERRLELIAPLMGAISGIAVGIIAAINGFGWWGALISIVGLFLGLILGMIIGDLLDRVITINPHRRRWKLDNPLLPELSSPAILMTSKSYKDARTKEKYSLTVFQCQNDEYAALLLQIPHYAKLQKMVDGQISRSQLVQEAFDVYINRYKK